MREFNEFLSRFSWIAAQGEYVAPVGVMDPSPEILAGRAEGKRLFELCDRLNRQSLGYVITDREHASQFSVLLDPLSGKLPELPEADASFDGGCLSVPSVGEEFTDIVSGGEFGESSLDFVSSDDAECTQSRLEVGAHPEFSDPLSLGGGLLAALLDGRFVVVDIRRARERILYEEYLRMAGCSTAVSQQLLFPERLVLSAEEYDLLEEHAVEFASLGFDIECCGAGAVEVKGTPADLPADAIDSMIYDLLQAFSTPVPLADVRRERIASVMARSGARTAPRSLGREEAESLLAQLAATGNVSFSPSGKAILVEITPEELRAKLG